MMRRILLSVYAMAGLAAPAIAQTPAIAYYNPEWSPDGRTLLFESNRDGNFDVYSVGADGSGLRKLTNSAANETQPRWSRDGTRIVYVSEQNRVGRIHVMNADGSSQRALMPVSQRKDFYPSFSPDGRWISFGSQDLQNRALYYVYVARSDGSGLLRLSDSTKSAEAPRWSRDGARIVFESVPLLERNQGEAIRDFVRRRDAATVTMSVLPDGRGPMLAPNEPPVGESLSPDGRSKAISKDGAGVAGIYVVDVATGAERRLTPPPG